MHVPVPTSLRASPEAEALPSRVLASRFGARIAEWVATVTDPVYEPDSDEHGLYREHVTASLQASPWTWVIKVSDFTDYAGVWIMPSTG